MSETFVGAVMEYRSLGASGLGEAVLRVVSGPEYYDDGYVRRELDDLVVTGDWRPMQALVEGLTGRQVAVKTGCGVDGAPELQLLEDDAAEMSCEDSWNPDDSEGNPKPTPAEGNPDHTWTCVECDYQVELSYDELAELHGPPQCPECGDSALIRLQALT